MTPKEKATELVLIYDKMLSSRHYKPYIEAKKSALIVVDEIINYLTTSLDIQTSLSAVNYWYAVKQEIEKL